MNDRHWLLNFFRWDIRTILAAGLGLVILIGFAVAATETTALIKFDFGGASLANRAAGMTAVKGGVSVYPQTTGTLQYGWTTADIVEFSDNSVADLMKRDYNSGPSGANFRVGGLEQGVYTLKATVGSPDGTLSTRMQAGGLAAVETADIGTWRTISLVVPANSGTMDVKFYSGNGADPWGICGLEIYRTTGTVSQAGFAVSLNPTKQTVSAGNVAVVSVGITPTNNYGDGVSAQISGLVSGMTAEFSPAEAETLPATLELRIYTSKAVPATDYALLVTVTGKDASATRQTTTLSLTILSPAGDQTSTGTDKTDTTNTVVVPILPVRTPEETKQDFASIDTFVAEQKVKALKKNNFSEMQEISDSLAPVPVFEKLPQAKTTMESILQQLVNRGIIGSTTDSAPAAEPASPKSKGFWSNLVESIFKKVS